MDTYGDGIGLLLAVAMTWAGWRVVKAAWTGHLERFRAMID